MSELNKLFVCSKCGESIAPQMDNLEIHIADIKSVVEKLNLTIKQLEGVRDDIKKSI